VATEAIGPQLRGLLGIAGVSIKANIEEGFGIAQVDAEKAEES